MGAFQTNTSAPQPASPAPQQQAQYAPVSIGSSMQAPQGKSGATSSSSSGKSESNITFPSQSGQPQMGVPNKYSNTVQPMDNRGMGIAGLQARGKGR